MLSYLDFEKPIAELEGKIAELKSLSSEDEAVGTEEEVSRLQAKADDALVEIYKKLTPFQKVQVARHPQRPHFSDYIKGLFKDFIPLSGDRKFGEDAAIQAGFARFNGKPVAIIGQEKGADTKSRLKHNFGMARPEGYRKAVRIMDMADRFNIPVIYLVDTSGAYPGVGAEERGQAEAIAKSTEKCLDLGVPNLAIIIGEGGSGGAIAIASANRVLMLEHAIYSVISPEAGASILFRDAGRAKDMAIAQKITAKDLSKFKVIDGIITEPVGGAHRNSKQMINSVGQEITKFLSDFEDVSKEDILAQREEKFLQMGENLT